MSDSPRRVNPLILFFVDGELLFESQQALLKIITGLDAKRYPYRVLAPSYDCELAVRLREQGIAVDSLALPAARTPGVLGWVRFAFDLSRYYRKLFRYVNMFKFEVVHSDGLRAHLLSVGIKVRFNTPLVWQRWTQIAPERGMTLFQWLTSVFCDHFLGQQSEIEKVYLRFVEPAEQSRLDKEERNAA